MSERNDTILNRTLRVAYSSYSFMFEQCMSTWFSTCILSVSLIDSFVNNLYPDAHMQPIRIALFTAFSRRVSARQIPTVTFIIVTRVDSDLLAVQHVPSGACVGKAQSLTQGPLSGPPTCAQHPLPPNTGRQFQHGGYTCSGYTDRPPPRPAPALWT